MANLLCDNGRYRVQFRLKPNSARQSVGLGRQSEADAEAIRARIKVLVDAYRAQSPPDPSTATWAARLPDDLYGKLAVPYHHPHNQRIRAVRAATTAAIMAVTSRLPVSRSLSMGE
jgi:hypothetical protein